jgi:hypothetical protein
LPPAPPDGQAVRLVLEAYEALLELPVGARQAAVEVLDPSVRHMVAAMLAADSGPDVPDLSDIWSGLKHLATAPAFERAPAPTQVAEFELVREIGAGAHGVVYEAGEDPRQRLITPDRAHLPGPELAEIDVRQKTTWRLDLDAIGEDGHAGRVVLRVVPMDERVDGPGMRHPRPFSPQPAAGSPQPTAPPPAAPTPRRSAPASGHPPAEGLPGTASV